MKLLLDANVILDVLLKRAQHYQASVKLLDACERGLAEGVLCATSVTTLYYLIAKERDRQTARRALENLLKFCQISAVTSATITTALQADWSDFEDAVSHEAASAASCDAIVTRNQKDFKKATLRVFDPEEACAVLGL